jgi:tryptophan synthase alpha chain
VSRIENCFARLRAQRRKALIPYLVAGDPAVESAVPLMHALVAAGADIIELGIPFSDPMAEGPVIQLAHERALANRVCLRQALDMLGTFREDDPDTPVLFMGYANPVERMGYVSFAEAAAEQGLDALLTVDIPPEEVADLNGALERHGMDNILLVAPTTPDERIALIAREASGFIYCVALKGVTGAGNLDVAAVASRVAQIRTHTALPVAVGFGIKDAVSAAEVSRTADGVVVGSVLVKLIADAVARGETGNAVMAEAVSLVADMRAAIDATD